MKAVSLDYMFFNLIFLKQLVSKMKRETRLPAFIIHMGVFIFLAFLGKHSSLVSGITLSMILNHDVKIAISWCDPELRPQGPGSHKRSA